MTVGLVPVRPAAPQPGAGVGDVGTCSVISPANWLNVFASCSEAPPRITFVTMEL